MPNGMLSAEHWELLKDIVQAVVVNMPEEKHVMLNVFKRFCGMSEDERRQLHQSYRILCDASLANLGFADGCCQLRMVLHRIFPVDLPLLPPLSGVRMPSEPTVPLLEENHHELQNGHIAGL